MDAQLYPISSSKAFEALSDEFPSHDPTTYRAAAANPTGPTASTYCLS
jgi:hypothetical protein